MKSIHPLTALARLVRIILTPTSGPVRCPRCERDLPEDAFCADRRRPSGRYPWCRDCCAAKHAAYWGRLCGPKRAARLAEIAEHRRRSLEAPGGRERQRKIAAATWRDGHVVRPAIERGLLTKLATGQTRDGRRAGWTRPDRKAEGESK